MPDDDGALSAPVRVWRNHWPFRDVEFNVRDKQEKTLTNERQERAARAEQMRKEREKADKRSRNLITVSIVVVVLALIVGGTFAVKKASKDNSLATALSTPKFINSNYGIDYTTEIATGKPAKSPVKIVLYEDFQCPACKAFEEAEGAFLKQSLAAGDISIEWRPFSFLDSPVTDDYSSRALNAAMCVLDTTDVKTYAKMHDILYAAQSPETGPGLKDAELNTLAKQAGAADLTSCIKTKKYGKWIDKSHAAVGKAGVTGTPTVMIDGKQVTGPIQNGVPGSPAVADLQKAILAAKSKS